MPTESIRVVDPDNGVGADYTSLAAWESVEERDLTLLNNGDGEIAVAKCRSAAGSADMSSLSIASSAWVTEDQIHKNLDGPRRVLSSSWEVGRNKISIRARYGPWNRHQNKWCPNHRNSDIDHRSRHRAACRHRRWKIPF